MLIPLVTMLSVIAALMIFSVVVLFGGLLVRCLRLPNDPPFDLLFTAPAPESAAHATPQQATQAAAQHNLDQQVLDHAKRICSYFLQCDASAQELAAWDDPHAKNVHKKINKILKNQKKDHKCMETWITEHSLLQHRDQVIKLSDRYADSNKHLQELLDTLPQPGMMRILVLGSLLILCIGMLIFAHILAQQPLP